MEKTAHAVTQTPGAVYMLLVNAALLMRPFLSVALRSVRAADLVTALGPCAVSYTP